MINDISIMLLGTMTITVPVLDHSIQVPALLMSALVSHSSIQQDLHGFQY